MDFTSYLVLLLWCLLAFTGTVIALTSLLMGLRKRAAGVFVGMVLLLVSSLIGIILTMPGFWWIAILPIYLCVACLRVWLLVDDHRAQFRLSTLLTLVVVTAVIIAGITMQRREYYWQQEIESRIAARGGQVIWDLDSIRGVVFFDAADSDLAEFWSDLERIRRLRSLQISGRQFTDASMQNVSHFTNLRELYLQNTQVSDTGLHNLKALYAADARSNGTRVTDRGLSD